MGYDGRKGHPGEAGPDEKVISRFRAIIDCEGVTDGAVLAFRKIIYDHYRLHSRSGLPWRKTGDPYGVLVSEVMLQQTPVARVVEKYADFMRLFPGFSSLAAAPFPEVLRIWKGLGYNRRVMTLKRTAEAVVKDYGGRLPADEKRLITLPGIGKYTAAAIAAFAFNRPALFIETNIRRVFIHFFFENREGIADAEIIPLVNRTLDASDPRHWYYALMDYGATLAKAVPNPNRRSLHYRRQSPFEGSNRQARGMILEMIMKRPGITKRGIERSLDISRVSDAIEQLCKEGFLKKRGRGYIVAS